MLAESLQNKNHNNKKQDISQLHAGLVPDGFIHISGGSAGPPSLYGLSLSVGLSSCRRASLDFFRA